MGCIGSWETTEQGPAQVEYRGFSLSLGAWRAAAEWPKGEEWVSTNLDVLNELLGIYGEAFSHDGYADIRVEIRILRRGQKEVIIHCGKQYRHVVDFGPEAGKGYRVIDASVA